MTPLQQRIAAITGELQEFTRRKSNPPQEINLVSLLDRLKDEIAAGRVSDRTRREFDGWVRQDREAAKRRYEEALALVRVDAEDLAREQS